MACFSGDSLQSKLLFATYAVTVQQQWNNNSKKKGAKQVMRLTPNEKSPGEPDSDELVYNCSATYIQGGAKSSHYQMIKKSH